MSFESIHNFYESLVVDEVKSALADALEANDSDFIQDVACIALNQLPTRYVRFQVDATFYLTSEERQILDISIGRVVTEAIEFVRSQPPRNSEDSDSSDN